MFKKRPEFALKREMGHAQLALSLAIFLQVIGIHFNPRLANSAQYAIVIAELGLAIILTIILYVHTPTIKRIRKLVASLLLGFLSLSNAASLGLVLHSLIVTHTDVTGAELLTSAIAIFITNIIVYAVWYWEIDSPGLTSSKWSRYDKDFQFTQQDLTKEFPNWQPQFLDYFYVSITNAINFAPADTKPLTHAAKLLMASQALISVFTLALVVARSVSILG